MGSTLGRFENLSTGASRTSATSFQNISMGDMMGALREPSAQALREHQYILLIGSISYSGMP